MLVFWDLGVVFSQTYPEQTVADQTPAGRSRRRRCFKSLRRRPEGIREPQEGRDDCVPQRETSVPA